MAVARERDRESRPAPGFFLFVRRRSTNDPARLRRTGIRLRVETQQKRRDVFARGAKDETPARRQVEHFGLAHHLGDERAETAADKRIRRDAKNVHRVRRPHENQMLRRQTKLVETAAEELAIFERAEILTHPQNRPRFRRTYRQRRGKARRRRALTRVTAEHLMKRTELEAAEAFVRWRKAKVRTFRGRDGIARLGAGNGRHVVHDMF